MVNTSRQLSEVQSLDMIREVTTEDVKCAMSSINSKKAPGPDGYNANFFKAN